MDAPGTISPSVVRLVRVCVTPLVRLCFRPTLRGMENLPAHGPFLLVSNHSAGLGLAEIFGFLALYLGATAGQRPLAGFALPIGFRVFPLSFLLRLIGAIPSTYDAAHETLSRGVPILMFPGGDHETLRPVWQANRVDFGGRTGFLRIALRAGVPIVPMGIAGSHYTAPVLFRSHWLATLLVQPRLIGVKRWGLSLLGVLGCIAILVWVPLPIILRGLLCWLWLGSPAVFLPWIPWTIRMQIGAPLQPSELFSDGDESPAALATALELVEHAIQQQVSRARN